MHGRGLFRTCTVFGVNVVLSGGISNVNPCTGFPPAFFGVQTIAGGIFLFGKGGAI